MIEVDISNIWGRLSLPDLLSMERSVFQAHLDLAEGWMDLPEEAEMNRLLALAEEIRECSELLVVLGDSPARAVLELLQGEYRNLIPDTFPVVYLDGPITARQMPGILQLLTGRDFSLCTTDMEAPALSELKWLLERRLGTDEANSRIHHDPWGFLPMAAAGIDLPALVRSMSRAKEEMDLRSFENPVWLYAAARTLLGRKGLSTELLLNAEPDAMALGRWWQSLLPWADAVPGCFRVWESAPLPETPNRFETLLRFAVPESAVPSLREEPAAEAEFWEDLIARHTDLDIPVIGIDCGALNAETLGDLVWFFRLSGALCRRLSAEN